MRQQAFMLMLALCGAGPASSPAADVGLIKVNGAIGPATAAYISRAIDVASARDYACLIIQLDTPGGLLDSTKDIVGKFYQSKVPTAVYVAPAPARAASAGAFITMAADIAAMAPHTRIGAAHPVELGMGGEVEKSDDVMKKKEENDTASFAESIAEKRDRNVQWARSAVLESASITAEKALELKVIDLIAKDVPDLLKQMNGREVDGQPLHTAGATVVPIPMSFREGFLQAVLRPEVMFILMLVVIYGIIGELSSPGAILPGVAGAIALILVLCMSAILPINIAGLALIGLAVALFIGDVFAPTHGVLTTGGIISFFLGALMLFNRSDAAFRLSLAYIIPATVVTALFFLFVVGKGLRAQWLPVRSGSETMLGKTAPALAHIDASGGRVFVEGEYWNATSDVPIEQGQPVVITAVEGLTLKVKPKQT
ncbi:MAG TPA: nodulation protein NfeD [Candidatus Acidoferrum sp.]|nr:nodulation protein NfeD [Candidatus Acidoferrum sp.]